MMIIILYLGVGVFLIGRGMADWWGALLIGRVVLLIENKSCQTDHLSKARTLEFNFAYQQNYAVHF